jgi:diaminopimelate epimerase/GNAT superfamily N-acetyltransferase
MKSENSIALQILPVSDLSELNPAQMASAVRTYQQAFATVPYQEAFTDDEACAALQYIFEKKGDVVVGQADDEVVSLAGGYMQDANVYYIEELAVNTDEQGQGFGRRTLNALITIALSRDPDALEIRTTTRNDKAISLYTSEGFEAQAITEVVAQARQDGRLGLDERVYLLKILRENQMEKASTLKRAAIVYPSGNTTAVVFDQMLDVNVNREKLNRDVMEAWKERAVSQPEIEQCCFVTLPYDPRAVARVEMFGGEFCGNATRSVIQLLTAGADYQGMIEVSGVNRPLNFNVSAGSVAVEMPLPQSGEIAKEVTEGTLVQLDGITQLVVRDRDIQKQQTPREMLYTLLKQDKYGLADQPAVGMTYYNPRTKKAEFAVWVNAVNTVFDETACGSGTCAIGVASALQRKQNQRLEVIQPSGESIVTEAAFDSETGKVVASIIAGKVRVLYDGPLALS